MAQGSWSQPYGDATSGSGNQTLVFPRSKPYGANSTNATDAISTVSYTHLTLPTKRIV